MKPDQFRTIKISYMAYWLVKSEPSSYSWHQFENDGQTRWDGVRNFAARNFLRHMKAGDPVLYYHSSEGTEIIGIAEVVREAYQDPTTEDPNWVAVDLRPVRKLSGPVSLKQIKADSRLADMALVRISRLSVQPVREAEWKVVMELSER